MSNHRVTYLGSGDRSQARCSCKQKSPIVTRGDAEGWWYDHLQEVERVRMHLGTRNPTLKSQHAWFVKQAEDTGNPVEDRELWRQLADEMERFLAKREPLQQEQLF